MPTFFTADLHLGHRRIVTLSERTWAMNSEELAHWSTIRDDVEARYEFKVGDETLARHDADLIRNINEAVGEDDRLYILGDFCQWDRKQPRKYFERAQAYRARINCHNLILVPGNHDLRNEEGVPIIAPLFSRWLEQGVVVENQMKFFLNHYPMVCWDGAHADGMHLHGHVHGRYVNEKCPVTPSNQWAAWDVGVDSQGRYRPWSVAELRTMLLPLAQRRHQMIKTREGFA